MHITYDVQYGFTSQCPNGGYIVYGFVEGDDTNPRRICVRKHVGEARNQARAHFDRTLRFTTALWNDGEHQREEHWDKQAERRETDVAFRRFLGMPV